MHDLPIGQNTFLPDVHCFLCSFLPRQPPLFSDFSFLFLYGEQMSHNRHAGRKGHDEPINRQTKAEDQHA